MESHDKDWHCMVKAMQYKRYIVIQANTVAYNVIRSAKVLVSSCIMHHNTLNKTFRLMSGFDYEVTGAIYHTKDNKIEYE